ncbi:maltase A2-like isoform X2 [Agrilus planipennis]|nr:maltase A2-like isoform X2 [Agrilus planipennis]
MKDVLIFWLDKGVDGFRIDAAPFLFEDAAFRDAPLSDNHEKYKPYEYMYLSRIYIKDLPETYDMIYQWRELLDNYKKQKGGNTR